MSSSPLRAAMVPVTRQMRAYFAPVNRTNETPTIFDPGLCGMFALEAPPVPWLDLGWVENFERWYGTATVAVRSGTKGLPTGQYRGPLEAGVAFDFREWGKLQMALAGGSEHMNVLAPAAGIASPAPSGGIPAPGVAVLAGSTASELNFGAGAASAFAAGQLIAVDVDYQQQSGYVGSGIAAAYVSNAAAVNQDVNYVRRVTFNVGRVTAVTATSVLLAQPLLGGAPAGGASAQVVVAFVDREGGSFFQEWSALFVAEEESGGRVCFYYPRLSPSAGLTSGSKGLVRESRKAIVKAETLESLALQASFSALPYADPNDGQTVLCYRSYFPAEMAGAY
ncbi:MAG TPA: hypothetical protein VMB19_08305 [Silvibacterium sp.]|nr:hypothetical protein [Silvibacterium sp.]